MKALKVLTIGIIFCGYLFSCSDNGLSTDYTTVSIGTTVEVKSGKTIKFNNQNNTEIDVTVISISDYRCPSDVICVWEGNAKVGFQVNSDKNIFYLCVNNNEQGCVQESVVFYEGTHYSLKLLDVMPYPTTNNTEDEKVAKFELRVVGIEN